MHKSNSGIMDMPASTECAGGGTFPVAENQCRVIINEWANPEYKHLIVEASMTALAARPGQFFNLTCPAYKNEIAFLRRPMSLYRVSLEAGTIEFLYKVRGVGTRGLATLVSGDILNALGPVGSGFVLPPDARHILLLARGVGLATLAPLAEFAVKQDVTVSAILSARSRALVMSADYLREVGANVLTVSDEDETSNIVHVESLIRQLHATQPFDLLTTCGSNRLLLLLQRLSTDLGVPGQVALEQHMACALGMCFACVRSFRKNPSSDRLTYLRVCKDGPVFDLQEAVS